MRGGKTFAAYGNGGNDAFVIYGSVSGSADGGAGTNSYRVDSWSGTAAAPVTGTLYGSGADTLSVTKDVATFDVTDGGFSSSDNLSLSFQVSPSTPTATRGILAANITGGGGDNTFNMTGWTGNASLNGVGNPTTGSTGDKINYTRDANLTLNSTGLGITPVTGFAGPGPSRTSRWPTSREGRATTRSPSAPSTANGTLSGGGGQDTVVLSRTDQDMTLTDTQLTVWNNAAAGKPVVLQMGLQDITRATLTETASALPSVLDASGFTLGQSTLYATRTGTFSAASRGSR